MAVSRGGVLEGSAGMSGLGMLHHGKGGLEAEMGHPKKVQEQGQEAICLGIGQCLSGGRVESPLVWQFKIPQAEQQTFGDALPAEPALHSLSVGALKNSFMENQINKIFHPCIGIISIPSHHSQGNLSTGESPCSG